VQYAAIPDSRALTTVGSSFRLPLSGSSTVDARSRRRNRSTEREMKRAGYIK